MKPLVKTLCGFLAVVLLTAFFAYAAVSMDLDPVADFYVAEKGLTTQTLKWKPNSKASGYKIYQKNAKGSDYTLIKIIDDSNQSQFVVEELDMETFYSFKISAYKSILGIESESDWSKEAKGSTLPRGEEIESIVEQTPRTLTVSWSKGINCTGYEIEYALNEDFSDAEIKEISGITTVICKIDELLKGETYHIRMRSFIDFDNERLYSDYSESYSATVKDAFYAEDIDPDKPMIALTFDDGPDFSGASKQILDVLEKYSARATFFVVGKNAKNNPENIKRKLSLGCEIGNHTYDHEHYGSSVTAQDIKECSDVIESLTGSRPTVFRSTGGMTTTKIRRVCKKEGMSLYYWSIDTLDWKYRDSKRIYKTVMKNVEDGDIILMHDIYKTTAKAVKRLVPKLRKKGYQFVTVSELIKYKTGYAPKPGVQYLNGTQTKN